MPRPDKIARESEGRIATELENCVLGIIAGQQPCTAYVIRRHLGVSLSSYWSASAGAIYPLLRRLETRGWICADEQSWGTRTRRNYTLTRSGRKKLREWLSPPVTGWAAAFTYDPIRTRVFFLDQATPAQRLDFLNDAIAATASALEQHRAEKKALAAELSEFDSMGRDGAISELQARLRWLRSVLARIEKSGK